MSVPTFQFHLFQIFFTNISPRPAPPNFSFKRVFQRTQFNFRLLKHLDLRLASRPRGLGCKGLPLGPICTLDGITLIPILPCNPRRVEFSQLKYSPHEGGIGGALQHVRSSREYHRNEYLSRR